MTRLIVMACCGVFVATLVMSAEQPADPAAIDREHASGSVQPPTDCGGEPCDAVLRGLAAFFDQRPHGLDGNGRSCADCHMPTNSFQLSPSNVEARFRLLEWRRRWDSNADDPLFRPIDADDLRTNGENARDFSNLRQNGLIRITFPLPPNVQLIVPGSTEVSNETFVDVWRAVPTVNDVALTGPDAFAPVWPRGPNPTGGYQLDARIASLQDQALGAFINHAQIQDAVPQGMLDDLASFQRVLFTSHRVRALADAVRTGAPLPDPDPPLNRLEEQGKVVFERACGQCHGGPGQSTGQLPVVRYHDISTQCPRPFDTVSPPRFAFAPCPDRLERNARTYEITQPDGSKIRRTSSDPGRALLTGVAGFGLAGPQDDWNKFDVTGLRGLRNTAPYFHNNSAAKLEEVVDHYTGVFNRAKAIAPPGVVPPLLSTDGVHFDRPFVPEERPALLAYLRKL
jgi:cytochrome c peroxidase